MSTLDDLPTWQELVTLRGWVGQGCPSAHRNYDCAAQVHVLMKLLEGLPHHLPHYAWGSPEWRAELNRHKEAQLVKQDEAGP